MIFAEPPASRYDWRFHLLGFPVRVHLYFWIASVLSAGLGGPLDPQVVVLWVPIVLVSILVHELGHAFAQRRYGGRPRIVLHGFGGLAISSNDDPRPWPQIMIALAGPLAGFLLGGLVMMLLAAAGYAPQLSSEPVRESVGVGVGYICFDQLATAPANFIVGKLLYVNIWWGLVNLLPVYPLDGGRVARELATLGNDVQRGIDRSIWLSITVAVAVAIYAATRQQLYLALLFGYLAYTNYQTLEAYQRYRSR